MFKKLIKKTIEPFLPRKLYAIYYAKYIQETYNTNKETPEQYMTIYAIGYSFSLVWATSNDKAMSFFLNHNTKDIFDEGCQLLGGKPVEYPESSLKESDEIINCNFQYHKLKWNPQEKEATLEDAINQTDEQLKKIVCHA